MFTKVIPSLQDLSKMTIATCLWTHPEVKSISLDYSSCSWDDWKRIEKSVQRRANTLRLEPDCLQEISNLCVFIGLQIRNLMDRPGLGDPRIKGLYRYYFRFMDHIHWTLNRTIDLVKLANSAKDDPLDLASQFLAACFFSMEDKIYNLWRKMSKMERRNVKFNLCDDKLSTYWIDRILSRGIIVENILEDDVRLMTGGLYASLHVGNCVAAKYFMDKLPSEFKNEQFYFNFASSILNSLIYTEKLTPEDVETELLCYVLSQMSADGITNVAKLYSSELLSKLLVWPFRDQFLLPISNLCWPFMSDFDFQNLLNRCKVMEEDYLPFKEVSQKLFSNCPLHLKKHFSSDGKDMLEV